MTIDEALTVLEGCDWLKITQQHVSASKWKTANERMFLNIKPFDDVNCLYDAKVSIRRKSTDSFAALLIRAAELVQAKHVPTAKTPAKTSADRCMCGSESRDLVWNDQLKHRLCRRCSAAWDTAAMHNDLIGPTTTDSKH
jgi:hypothetical protein